MKPPTDKIVAAVRYEGVFEDAEGNLIDGSIEKAQALQDDGRYIVLVSPKTQTTVGLQMLMQQIVVCGIPYDEVWQGFGIPEADEWYDPNAMGL